MLFRSKPKIRRQALIIQKSHLPMNRAKTVAVRAQAAVRAARLAVTANTVRSKYIFAEKGKGSLKMTAFSLFILELFKAVPLN